uniref:Transgelin n=1 Tax=Latimeria chalumnae TaxID=7897 RepID=H3BHB2_LATCH
MANSGPVFGLSKDIKSKIEKKYDPELEDRLVDWIIAQCGAEVGRPETGRSAFQVWLKDGTILSKLINSLYSDGAKPVKKIQNSPLAFKQMEQVSQFLAAAEKYGVSKTDTFQTVDLWEGTFGKKKKKKLFNVSSASFHSNFSHFPLPIGTPHNFHRKKKKKKRDYHSKITALGKGLIKIRQGKQKGASQAGMTGYGSQRQIIG